MGQNIDPVLRGKTYVVRSVEPGEYCKGYVLDVGTDYRGISCNAPRYALDKRLKAARVISLELCLEEVLTEELTKLCSDRSWAYASDYAHLIIAKAKMKVHNESDES